MTDPITTHSYATHGRYNVNLTVTNSHGFSHSITKSVTVKLYTSIITLNIYPMTVIVGSNVTISGTITPTKSAVNVTISYRLSTVTTWDVLATIKTDSNSHYTYTGETTLDGKHEIKANWPGDENTWSAESETKTVTIDSTPPTTLDEYDGLWRTTDSIITLAPTDDLSGVNETYYRINGGQIQNLSIHGQPLITTEGANNTLEYWSVDNALNEELPHNVLTGIKLDKTPPTIGVPSRTPDDEVLPGQAVKISVNVTDTIIGVNNVTLFYTIDAEATWDNLPMNYSLSTGLYETTIPPQQAGTWVKYKIVAYDIVENNATKDGTEQYCIYQVIPEFPSFIIMPLFMIVTLIAVLLHRRKRFT